MLNGQQIKHLLEIKGITHQKLGNYLGFSKNYITMMCNNNRRITEKNYKKIKEFLQNN